MYKIKIKDEQGFTIIETLISLTILSSILLISTLSVMYIGNIFYKANALAATENNSRDIINDVEQDIQYSDGSISYGEGYIIVNGEYIPEYSVCIDGNVRYTFAIGYALNSNGGSETDASGNTIPYLKDVLWRDQDATPTSDDASTYPVTATNIPIPVLSDTFQNIKWQEGGCTPVNLSTISSSGYSGQELLQANSRLTNFDVSPSTTSTADQIDVGVAYGPIKGINLNVSTNLENSIKSAYLSLVGPPSAAGTVNDYMLASPTSPISCLTQIGDQDCATSISETDTVPRGN